MRSSLHTSPLFGNDVAVVGLFLALAASAADFFLVVLGSDAGDLALGAAGGVLLLLVAAVSLRKAMSRARPILMLFALFVFVYVVSFLRTPSLNGVKHLAQIVLLAGVFCFFANIRLTANVARGAQLLAVGALFLFLPFAISVADQVRSNEFLRKNVLGGIIYYLLLIVGLTMPGKWARWSLIPIIVCVAILLNERILFVMVLALIVSYGVLSAIRTRKAAVLLLLVSIVVVAVFMATYALPNPPEFYGWLDDFVTRATGRSIYSGRQKIWPLVFAKILQSPWMGHGAGVTPQSLLRSDLSAHNLYLQVLLQVGIVGLVALLALLVGIWRELTTNLITPVGRFAAAGYLTILLHASTEVSLTQNQIALGLLQWTFIGLSWSCAVNVGWGAPGVAAKAGNPSRPPVPPMSEVI